jgi:hypothetical protein
LRADGQHTSGTFERLRDVGLARCRNETHGVTTWKMGSILAK